MKARVIATGHIVDVELSHYIGDVAWYITKCNASYSENELEFIDAPEDYWTRLEHQAAIAAMQGILSNPESELDYIGDEALPQAIAACAAKIAHAIVDKYKKEEK